MRLSIAGLSLVELMVVVGILGVLGVIAMPRYKSFLVQSRRGEARAHLAQLANLQEMYKAEHGNYYSGPAMTGTNGIGYKDGKGNPGNCRDPSTDIDEGIGNKLGFRPNDCRHLRYFYQFRGGSAVASAASDDARKHRYIYPDCNGYGCFECGYEFGDAMTMSMSDGKPTVCRNITKYCPEGGGGCPPPPPPCPGSCPSGYTLRPPPACCQLDCKCVLSGLIPGTWQFTTTPAPNLSTTYECKEFYQKKEDLKPWVAVPTGCKTCPPPVRIPHPHRTVRGHVPIDCTPAGLTACPCESGDTRICCTTAPPCTCTDGTPSAWAPPLPNLTNIWDCQGILQTRTVPITCTPHTPTCRNYTRDERQVVCGDKAVTCADACTDEGTIVWSSECEEIMPPTDCRYKGEMKTTCNSPCAATSPGCNTLDVSTCPTTRPLALSERISCPCPDKCVTGDYIGMTEAEARHQCKQDKGVGATFIAINVPPLDCNCDATSPCLDDKGNPIFRPNYCNAPKYEWLPDPVCRCVGKVSGGAHDITVCISTIKHTSIGTYDLGLTEWDTIRNPPYNVEHSTRPQWEDFMKKLMCGGGGAVAAANSAAASTVAHIIHAHTLKVDGADTPHSSSINCSLEMDLTWTCN